MNSSSINSSPSPSIGSVALSSITSHQQTEPSKTFEPLFPYPFKALQKFHNDIQNKLQAISALPILGPYFSSIKIFSQYGFFAGALIGGARESRLIGLQYQAEHQHWKMRDKIDWYIYFRGKNYKMLKAFFTGGMKMGLKMAFLCSLYASMERTVAFTRAKLSSWGWTIPYFIPSHSPAVVRCHPLSLATTSQSSKKFYFIDDSWNTLITAPLFGSLFAILGPHRMEKSKFGIKHGLILGGTYFILNEWIFKSWKSSSTE